MIDELKNEKTLLRILLVLLIIAVGSYVFGIARDVLANFADIIIILFLAWLLSFILEPIVDIITKHTGIAKVWATLITYLLITGLFTIVILLFIPTVTDQTQKLAKVLPGYLASTQPFLSKWSEAIVNSLNNSILFVPSVAQFFFSLFVVLIFSFYFLIDKDHINEELFDLIPEKWHKHVAFAQKTINETFASFLRVQLIFGIVSGIFTWIVLTIFAVDFAASTALLAGILTVIPLIGPVLAIIPPVFVSFLLDPNEALIVFLLLLVMQQILFNVVGPKLLSNAFKIHPAIIIISFFVGFKVAGSIGAVFAVPVLGIAIILFKRLSHHFFKP